MANSGELRAILDSWKFSSEHVNQEINSGKFISAKSVLLVALNNIEQIMTDMGTGKMPTTDALSGRPIGVVQSWSIQQQKEIQPLFEIGSSLPYYIPGNSMAAASLTKVVFSGGSLLANLYNFSDSGNKEEQNEAGFKVRSSGGDDWFAINLAAKRFNRPTTLLWVLRNNDEENIGAYLLKNAFVDSHAISTEASSIVIMESASMRFQAAFPVSLQSL